MSTPRLFLIVLAGAAAACQPGPNGNGPAPALGDASAVFIPPAVGGASSASDGGAESSDGGVGVAPADMTPRRPPPPDLRSTDLAGLVDCFDVAVCDPAAAFCIRYHSGSTTSPGSVAAGSPACYQPDNCNGTTMNCTCIKQDANLGGACSSCVDNANGTYDCYAM